VRLTKPCQTTLLNNQKSDQVKNFIFSKCKQMGHGDFSPLG
jgi:hypothetical protein